MGIIINGTTPSAVTVNGTSVDRVVLNGTEVWTAAECTSVVTGKNDNGNGQYCDVYWGYSEGQRGSASPNCFKLVHSGGTWCAKFCSTYYVKCRIGSSANTSCLYFCTSSGTSPAGNIVQIDAINGCTATYSLPASDYKICTSVGGDPMNFCGRSGQTRCFKFCVTGVGYLDWNQ